MLVYLRNGDDIQRVPCVSLEKCYKPCVGTFVEERVEPALWYKVLVLDSVFVDCDSRNVYWNIEKCKAARDLHHLETVALRGQEVYEFFKNKGKKPSLPGL